MRTLVTTLYLLTWAMVFMLNLRFTCSQDDVTIEMFNVLQGEVNDLYNQLGTLQGEVQTLAQRIQNLEANTGAIGDIELAELQALIAASNKQEEDLTKLFHTNGIWQQNFKVINNTFARLRKVVVFPIPALNTPMIPVRVRRILPVIQERTKGTVVLTNTTRTQTKAVATTRKPKNPRG